MSFICHIDNYTEYNQQWNVFSAFNPFKCTHTWSSGQPTLRHTGSSWGFGALLKDLTSVVDNCSRSRDSNPQPRVTSPTLYPLKPRLPPAVQKPWQSGFHTLSLLGHTQRGKHCGRCRFKSMHIPTFVNEIHLQSFFYHFRVIHSYAKC